MVAVNPRLIIALVGGYITYRLLNAQAEVDLLTDLTSTAQNIGQAIMPTDIPFECRDPQTGVDYKPLIYQHARANLVPPLLLAALIRQESAFKATVVNRSSGAMGLGQFMPATAAEWFGSDWQTAVYIPDRAISTTAKYLAWLYRRHSAWRFAVAAYNWGTGNVKKYGLASMPSETRNYVAVIYDRWSDSLPA